MEADEENPFSIPPPPVILNIAPIRIIPASIARHLAPVPICAPLLRPYMAQSGEAMGHRFDCNEDEAGTSHGGTDIWEECRLVREQQEKAMRELVMQRYAAAVVLPTNDVAVQARLGHLGEPVTLFGERETERRERLQNLMVKLVSEGQLERLMKAHEDEEASGSATQGEGLEEDGQSSFFTEGSEAVLDAEVDTAKYSSVEEAALGFDHAGRKRDDADHPKVIRGSGKRKIEIKKVENESRRMVTFSKRRKGLFKKADQYCSDTGAKIAIVAFSPAGNPYVFGDVSAATATLLATA